VSHAHLPVDEIFSRLRETPLFADVDETPLRELVARGEIVDLEPGEVLIRQGDVADALYVVLDGELEVTRQSGESRLPVAVVGPGSLQGEIAALEGGTRVATVAATRTAEVLRIPVDAMRELLAAGPDVALSVIRTAVARLRAMEVSLREREKLAALGTLSAGLAHELNNPAAAALRSIAALEAAVSAAEASPRPSPPPRPPADTAKPRTALERADRISEIEAIAGSAEAASALVEAGWTAASLREQPTDVVPWLAADASVRQLLGELEIALSRISDIVGAVKGYTYLDQAPVGRVDVRIGLEQTLVILRHRLRDIEVRTEIADDLPPIEAYGSELNQVWTNLIDNAVDAMDGRGALTVRAEAERTAEGAGVRVTIADSGSGIPPDVRARLFEPFYTTKEPGKGTGLGLHISYGVVARHGGRIEVDSAPGDPAADAAADDRRGRRLGAQPVSGWARRASGDRTRRVVSSSPAMMNSTPSSWNALGASLRIQIPSRTDPTGWIVSTTLVTAAGRRGRLMLISNHPTTWTLSASRTSQPWAGQVGTRSTSPSGSPMSSETIAADRVASNSGPAGRRGSALARRCTRRKPA